MVSRPIHVIIVAAGTGTRFGSDIPKQFHRLRSTGLTILETTVSAFRHALPDADIHVVVSNGMEHLVSNRDVTIVIGGPTRFHSVQNAVRNLELGSDDIILVHDGARPLVDDATIHRVVAALGHNKAVIPVVPVTDSLRHVKPDGTTHIANRAEFRAVQTPQGFDATTLSMAYATEYKTIFTDDASVVEADGVDIATIDGNPENIKITNRADLDMADSIISSRNQLTDELTTEI